MTSRDRAASLDWRRGANCAGMDPEMFFPEAEDMEAVSAAKAVCNTGPCPVRQECLAYALGLSIKHGVWGGWGEYERKRMRLAAHGGQAAAEAVRAGRVRWPSTRPPGRRDPTRPRHPVAAPPPDVEPPGEA